MSECDRQGTPVTLTGSDSPWPVSVLRQCVAAPGWREAAFGWGGAKGCRLHCTPEGLDPNLQTQECYTTPPSHQTVPSRVLAYRAVVQSHHHVYIHTHRQIHTPFGFILVLALTHSRTPWLSVALFILLLLFLTPVPHPQCLFLHPLFPSLVLSFSHSLYLALLLQCLMTPGPDKQVVLCIYLSGL